MSALTAALKHLSSGVMVVSVADGDKVHAFTAAWVMQVSFSPVLLAISINPEHSSYELFKSGRVCTINVLAQSQMALAAHYGQSGLKHKMTQGTWSKTEASAPVLQESLAYFDCCWVSEMAAGDHQLVVCEVRSSGVLNQGVPMLYTDTENMDGSAEIMSSSTER